MHKIGERVFRAIGVMLVTVLLLNLTTFSVAQAGENQHDACEECSRGVRHLPRGPMAWDKRDFAHWLQSANVSGRAKAILEAILANEELVPLIMTESTYSEWLSSLDPAVARKIDQCVVKIPGSALPTTIRLHGTEDQIAALESAEEYVVGPGESVWCEICKMIVEAFVAWALARWVFDPIGDWLDIQWRKVVESICRHVYQNTEVWDTTRCPYQPACMGTWQRVEYDDGVRARCTCECGAVWWVYNPLY